MSSNIRSIHQAGLTSLQSLILIAAMSLSAAAFAAMGGALETTIARNSVAAPFPAVTSSAQAGMMSPARAMAGSFGPPLGDLPLPPTARSTEALAPNVPARFKVPPGARERFGSDLDLIASGLGQGDPEADALIRKFKGREHEVFRKVRQAMREGRVPDDEPEIADFLRRYQEVPSWVDFDQLNLGGDVMVRGGLHGLSALFFQSLSGPYLSPSGVKPLVYTEELLRPNKAFARMVTTQSYVNNVCAPGGLCPGALGWQQTALVRLGHAKVRAELLEAGFDTSVHGMPINQSDMAGTSLAFSVAYLDAMRRMGFEYTTEEADALVALWKYAGYLNGVEPSRMFQSEARARRFAAATMSTQGFPDADSRALMQTLTTVRGILPRFNGKLSPFNTLIDRMLVPTTERVLRLFLGHAYADLVDLPKRNSRLVATFLRSTAQSYNRAIKRDPERAVRLGRATWNEFVEHSASDDPVRSVPGGKGLFAKRGDSAK